MASKLIGKTVRTQSRRAVGDMAVRTDAILDSEVFTHIMHRENPSSILSIFGRGFGDIVGMTENNDDYPDFQLRTDGLGASYINIKEEYEKATPLRVVDNSKVPPVILANQPFDVTVDRGYLDEDEFFHLKDQKSMGRVVSRRIGINSEMTVVVNGLPGETFSSSLFSIGAPLIYGMGNSQGEGSKKSNTIPVDEWQYNTFFNPMVISRYVIPFTGSYLADEMYTLRQQAMDGTESEVNTGLSARWVNAISNAMSKQMLYSTANFDPKTKEILGRSNNSRYPERPSYAGIYQQMDQAPIKFLHQINDSARSGILKIERIMQTIAERPGNNRIMFAMCQSVGYNWLMKQIREGGLERYGMRIQVAPEADAITVGYRIDKFVTNYGDLYVYNVSKSMPFVDEYDKVSFDGAFGSPRSRDIFFFPGTRSQGGRPTSKIAKLFVKEGQIEGHGKVSRGLVIGNVSGITGENNSMRSDAANQESMLRAMMDGRNNLGSIVDGKETHVLWENVPYIDCREMVKLSLL